MHEARTRMLWTAIDARACHRVVRHVIHVTAIHAAGADHRVPHAVADARAGADARAVAIAAIGEATMAVGLVAVATVAPMAMAPATVTAMAPVAIERTAGPAGPGVG